MKKIFFILFIIFIFNKANADNKKKIIYNFSNINNLTFNFEQNINGKIENGACILQYPKKIFCKYNLSNQKILVSNGKSMIIKTKSSYYLYPIDRTPLNFLLDKDYLLKQIENLDEKIIDSKYINYKLIEKDHEINIFFDKNNFDLVGWQTIDIYQNLSITFISSLIKNRKLGKNLFKLPEKN